MHEINKWLSYFIPGFLQYIPGLLVLFCIYFRHMILCLFIHDAECQLHNYEIRFKKTAASGAK